MESLPINPEVFECPRCHTQKLSTEFYYRMNNGKLRRHKMCKECECADALARYYANREHALTVHRAWRMAHQEEVRLYSAQYRKIHVQDIHDANQRYGRTHPRTMTPSARLRVIRRRARKRELPDTWTPTQRQFMLDYWHHACAICGNQEGLFWTLADDHWIPLRDPLCPGTVAHNMLPLCHTRKAFVQSKPSCNHSKSAKQPHDWLLTIMSPHKAHMLERKIATYFAIAMQQI